jgi:hypothetical protein
MQVLISCGLIIGPTREINAKNFLIENSNIDPPLIARPFIYIFCIEKMIGLLGISVVKEISL